MAYSVVIPNKYEDVITPLIDSIHKYVPGNKPDILVVSDNHDRNYGFRNVVYDDKFFMFAKAVNLGIANTPKNHDILLLNDDCRLLEDNFFDRFWQAAQAHPRMGILSPLVVGCVGTPQQRWHERHIHWGKTQQYYEIKGKEGICFPCVYISRRLLESVGGLREAFYRYGGEDLELSQRARSVGFKTAVTSLLKIQHADGSEDLGDGRGKSWSVSYMRRFPGGSPSEQEVNEYIRSRQTGKNKS
jgi:hypothetical protein